MNNIIAAMEGSEALILLPTSQPSEDARLARREHYRAVQYAIDIGVKNLEWFGEM